MKKKNYAMAPAYLLLGVFAVTIALGYLLVFAVSITNELDLSIYGFRFIPKKVDFSAYAYIVKNSTGILNAYKVSIIYSVFGTFLSLIIMTMISYALSRPAFKFKRAVSFYIFFTMLFSGGLTPSYILITQYLKIQDTIWVLILPGLVNCFHIILMRTFFQQLPSSLFESAKIDGSSEFRIYTNIVIPLSKPVIATVAFLGLLGRWNDWFNPKLYINDYNLYPVQYLLQSMLANVQFALDMMKNVPAIDFDTRSIPRENLRMAMMVVSVLPMMFVFLFFQKYFVKGLTVGSIKG
jgi:ABC-type sugar transport system, permease component